MKKNYIYVLILAVTFFSGYAFAEEIKVAGDCVTSVKHAPGQDLGVQLQVAADATTESLGTVVLRNNADNSETEGIATGTLGEYSFGDLPAGDYTIVCESCCPSAAE